MSNLHANQDEANKHTAKGFDLVGNNTRPWKDENNEQTFTENNELPRAINFVDGTLAPPSTTDGDVFVLIGSGVLHPNWGGNSFGNWVRYRNLIPVGLGPVKGMLCYDDTASAWMEFDGSVWATFGGGGATNLSEGTSTTTTVDVDSDTGTNATLQPASTIRAGVMSKAKFDEVEVNNAKVSDIDHNATHTSEVTGSTALTVQPIAVSNKTLITATGTMELLVNDAGTLKKVVASDFLGGVSSNLYTANGTLTDARTVTMAGFGLTFGGGQTTIKGSGATSATSALLVEDSSGVDSLKVLDDGNIVIGETRSDVRLKTGSSTGRGIFSNSDVTTYLITYGSAHSTLPNSMILVASGGISMTGDADVTGAFSVGVTTATAKLHVKGIDQLGTTSSLLIQNSVGLDLLDVRNDGTILGNLPNIYGANGTLTGARTVTMASFGLTFTGGQTTIKGFNTLGTELAILVENSSAVDLFKIDNSGGFALGNAATYTGNKSVSIGRQANANTDAVGIGYLANASGTLGAVALGKQSIASGSYAIGIGYLSNSAATESVAIGRSTIASTGDAVSLGTSASATVAAGNIAIGKSSSASGAATALAVGVSSIASGQRSLALGAFMTASATGAIMIGGSTGAKTNATSNSVEFNFNETTSTIRLARTADSWINTSGDFGIGTATPLAKLHINGDIRIDDTTTTGKTISTDFLPINVNGTIRYVALYD